MTNTERFKDKMGVLTSTYKIRSMKRINFFEKTRRISKNDIKKRIL